MIKNTFKDIRFIFDFDKTLFSNKMEVVTPNYVIWIIEGKFGRVNRMILNVWIHAGIPADLT